MPKIIRIGNSEYVNRIFFFLALMAAKLLIMSLKSNHFAISLSVHNIVRSESQDCPIADLRWFLMSFNLEKLSHDATNTHIIRNNCSTSVCISSDYKIPLRNECQKVQHCPMPDLIEINVCSLEMPS